MEHRERELVSMGTGIALAVLAGLVVWLLSDSDGWAVVVALIVGTCVWLWLRPAP